MDTHVIKYIYRLIVSLLYIYPYIKKYISKYIYICIYICISIDIYNTHILISKLSIYIYSDKLRKRKQNNIIYLRIYEL